MLTDVITVPDRRRSYLDQGLWTDDTLVARVGAHARRQPEALAVVDQEGRRRVTYAQLHRDASVVAAALRSRGVGRGAVVSVQLPNCYEAIVSQLAALAVPAVLNPLLPNYRARELAHVFAAARPKAIFAPADRAGADHRVLVADARRTAGTDTLHVVVGDEARGDEELALHTALAADGDRATPPGSAHDVSELIFTSGTEATPKPIMHTEQTANFGVRAARRALGMTRRDVVWMPSPVGHSTGLNFGVRMALYHGLPLVLQERWDAEVAAGLVEREGCTYTLAATTFLKDLVEAGSGRDLRSLRRFGCGGAPVPPELVDAGERLGIGVLRLYGSTEVLVATWNRPGSPVDKRRATDGCPLDHVEVEVRDEAGRALAPGEPGELFVRSPAACVGFFDDPVRTSDTFLPDGWLRSGDLCALDEDGYLTVVGRKKEIIIRGGMNIAPREIEDLLLRFPEVDRAAVIGLPDSRLGERSCACLVLRPGRRLELATVVERLRVEGLASYKLPEELHVVDALPTTASGKVQKHELARMVSGDGAPG